MFSNWIKALWAFLLLATVAQAQFQFFEHMFGGGGGGQRQARQEGHQDGPSDSSWYQDKWENGKSANIALGSYRKLADEANISLFSSRRLQHAAPNIYALILLPAFISHITALVRIRKSKRRLNWAREVLSVSLREGIKREKRRARLNWLGKVFCEVDF